MDIEAIRTDRMTLEPLTEAHAVEMVPVLAPPALYGYTGGEPPDLDALTRRYRFQSAGSPEPDEIWLNWILREHDADRAVGYVQATVEGSTAALAWLVAVDRQGQGLAIEAARAMYDWLADRGVSAFEAFIHPEHVASQRVASAIGLSATGRFDDDGEERWSS